MKCSRITRGGSGARPPGGLHCGFSSNGPIDRQQTPYPRWTRAADDLTELRCITRSGAQSTGTSSVIIAHSSYSSLCTSPPLGARPSILLPMHANTISHKQKLQRKKGRPHKSSSHENPSVLGLRRQHGGGQYPNHGQHSAPGGGGACARHSRGN